MNKKGQIITVDFVFSLMILMLALGYTFRIAEANNYKLKEEEQFKDVQRLGTAASELLVSNPDLICEVQGADIDPLPVYNCVVENKLNGVTAGDLRIPSGYSFEILIEGGVDFVHKAGDTAPDDPTQEDFPNVYSETRQVLWFGSNPTKAEFEGAGSGDERYLMVKVWKP